MIESEKRLHSLTTREGDWFLDELSGVTENMLEYVNLNQIKHLSSDVSDRGDEGDSKVTLAPALKEVINGVHKVYASLQVRFLCFKLLAFMQMHVRLWLVLRQFAFMHQLIIVLSNGLCAHGRMRRQVPVQLPN